MFCFFIYAIIMFSLFYQIMQQSFTFLPNNITMFHSFTNLCNNLPLMMEPEKHGAQERRLNQQKPQLSITSAEIQAQIVVQSVQ